MDEQDLDKIKEILPGLAKEFFSKFPAKDNHRLNLYADILGFFAAVIITYVSCKIIGPFSNTEDTAWRLIKTIFVIWGFWFLFMIVCLRTTYFKGP